MTGRMELQERYEDALFALLMDDLVKERGEQLLAEPAQAEDQYSPELDRRCRQAIAAAFAKLRRRRTGRAARKLLRWAVTAAAILAALFTTAFAVSEDFRVSATNLFITVTEKYTEFRMEQSSDAAVPEGEPFQKMQLGWLPEGFAYFDGQYDSWVIYMNETGAWVSITCIDGSSTLLTDTEDAVVEDITINGVPSFLITKKTAMESRVSVLVSDTENSLFIMVDGYDGVAREDVIRIAENITVTDGAQANQTADIFQ